MPQPIAYNSGNPISGSIEKSTLSFTVEGAPRNERDYSSSYAGVDWYSTIPPQDGKYVIISASNPPMIWVTADETDAELLITVNGLPDRYNQTLFTDTGSALSWLGSNAYFVSRETPDQIDADSMILSIDASQLSSYPREGTNSYDLSGVENNGTLANGTTFDSRGWFNFVGTDDEITVPDNVGLRLTTDMSFEFLVKVNSSQNNPYPRLIDKSNWLVHLSQTSPFSIAQNINTSSGLRQVGVGSAFSSDTWTHILTTYDGQVGKIYTNGKLVSTNSWGSVLGATTSGTTVTIGGDTATSRQLNGNIAKTKIYNRALSESDVKQNYYGGPIVTDGLVLAMDASNLVSYESGSTTAYSLTGSLSGSLVNGVGYNPQNGGTWAFDGVDDYINLGSPSSLSNAQFTITFWYNPSTLNNILYNGIINGKTPGGKFCLFWFNGTTLSVQYQDDSGLSRANGGVWTRSQTATGAVSETNKWYFIQITGNETTDEWRVGVNLNVSTSDFGSQYVAPNNLWLLGYSTLPDHGKIANFQVYNRILTQEEIQQNYSATKQKYLF